jgi:hypothetical protein
VDLDLRMDTRIRQGRTLALQSSYRPKLHSYEGDSYVEQFLAQFECAARLSGWPHTEWGAYLVTLLDKEARRVLQTDYLDVTGRRPSYTKLCSRLRETFGPRGTEDLWRHKAETYQKARKKSLVQMAYRIENYTQKAFPRMRADDRKAITVGNFIRALPSASLRSEVRKSRPKTLAEALETATFLQNVENVEYGREQAGVFHMAAESNGVNKSRNGSRRLKTGGEYAEEYEGDEEPQDEEVPPT